MSRSVSIFSNQLCPLHHLLLWRTPPFSKLFLHKKSTLTLLPWTTIQKTSLYPSANYIFYVIYLLRNNPSSNLYLHKISPSIHWYLKLTIPNIKKHPHILLKKNSSSELLLHKKSKHSIFYLKPFQKSLPVLHRRIKKTYSTRWWKPSPTPLRLSNGSFRPTARWSLMPPVSSSLSILSSRESSQGDWGEGWWRFRVGARASIDVVLASTRYHRQGRRAPHCFSTISPPPPPPVSITTSIRNATHPRHPLSHPPVSD